MVAALKLGGVPFGTAEVPHHVTIKCSAGKGARRLSPLADPRAIRIECRGALIGPRASRRAKRIDEVARSGLPVLLECGESTVEVLVEKFRSTPQGTRVQYRLEYSVPSRLLGHVGDLVNSAAVLSPRVRVALVSIVRALAREAADDRSAESTDTENGHKQ